MVKLKKLDNWIARIFTFENKSNNNINNNTSENTNNLFLFRKAANDGIVAVTFKTHYMYCMNIGRIGNGQLLMFLLLLMSLLLMSIVRI